MGLWLGDYVGKYNNDCDNTVIRAVQTLGVEQGVYAQQTRGIHLMLLQCWSTVFDADPTLKQHRVTRSLLGGRHRLRPWAGITDKVGCGEVLALAPWHQDGSQSPELSPRPNTSVLTNSYTRWRNHRLWWHWLSCGPRHRCLLDKQEVRQCWELVGWALALLALAGWGSVRDTPDKYGVIGGSDQKAGIIYWASQLHRL